MGKREAVFTINVAAALIVYLVTGPDAIDSPVGSSVTTVTGPAPSDESGVRRG